MVYQSIVCGQRRCVGTKNLSYNTMLKLLVLALMGNLGRASTCVGLYVNTNDTWTGCDVARVGTLDCMFEHMDQDGDFKINRLELSSYVATLPFHKQVYWTRHGVGDQLFRADKDKDHKMSLPELMQWVSCEAVTYLPDLMHNTSCA